MRYILRRLAFYALALFVSVTINFALPRLMPGDPATAMFVRFQGRLEPEALEALKITFGFTEGPMWQQYIGYVSHVVRGDFGISISHFPDPVGKVILSGLWWTVLLSGTGLLLAYSTGTLLGILSAWRRGSRVDSGLLPFLIFVHSFPYFWLAMLALLVFGAKLQWFPLRHGYSDDILMGPTWPFLRSVLQHLALPALTIATVSVGGWMLGMRNVMIGVLAEDYITMAEAKGLTQTRIMFRYAARNALLPNITSFGMALGFVVSGALLTETVFAYPGLGQLLFQAVSARDYPLLQGLFLMITATVLGANFVVDLLYFRLDPRVRAR